MAEDTTPKSSPDPKPGGGGDEEDGGKQVLGIARLCGEARPYWGRMGVATVFLVITTLSNLATPVIFGRIVDVLTGSGAEDGDKATRHGELVFNVIVLLVVAVVQAIATFIRAYLFNSSGVMLVAQLRRKLYQHIMRQEIAFFDQNKTGELLSRLGGDTTMLKDAVTTNVSMALRNMATVLGGIVYLFLKSWKLALVMLALVPTVAVLAVIYGGFVRQLSKDSRKALADSSEVAEESFTLVRTVRSFAAEARMYDKYTEKVDETERLGLCVAACSGLFMGLVGLIATGCFAGIVFYGGTLVLSGSITSGVLTSFLLLAITIGASIGGLAALFGSLMSALGANERVFAILDKQPTIPLGEDDGRKGADAAVAINEAAFSSAGSMPQGSLNGGPMSGSGAGASQIVPASGGASALRLRATGGALGGMEAGQLGMAMSAADVEQTMEQPTLLYTPKVSFSGRVDLRDVWFTYPTRPDSPVLRGISLSILPGQQVALVGSSGAGKSTVAQLLERFYDMTSGQILLDGIDIRRLDPGFLRASIGMVRQEPVLFGGSIGDNIRFGRPDATQDQIEEAAKVANAHDFIVGMADGYDTLCGEKGVRLSGGQKQRVALARAVIKNCGLLIADEASSALDAESEAVVLEALSRVMRGKSSLSIAHRLSTVRGADVVCMLSKGVITASGSHEELMGKSERYKQLVRRQLVHSDAERVAAGLGPFAAGEEEDEEDGEEEEGEGTVD